jgi:glycosyltransferase involved in cell wall biosynthesis
MRIGFTLGGSMRATGCYYYLLNLLQVLKHHAADRLTPVLLVGDDESDERLTPFELIPGLEIRRSAALRLSRHAKTTLNALVLGRDKPTSDLFRSFGLDAVFEAATFFGWRVEYDTLAWFPDLQHRSLPHLFTHFGWWRRELGFRAQVISGRHVIVSSEDARKLALRYYLSSSRISVVSFALPPSLPIDEDLVRETVARYNLPDQYFFLPNQFWRHKNHILVIQALSILSRNDTLPTVVAVGLQADLRNPRYINQVYKKLHEAGLEGSFLMPGLLPRQDMAPLLYGATALLNPSLFEGWSTSVEEAKSAGVPMILSDLPVHREQAGDEATYFDPHDPSSLAAALASFPVRDRKYLDLCRAEVMHAAETRTKQFANSFIEAVQQTSRTAHNQ